MLISNRKAFVRIQIMDFRAKYSLQWLILPAGDLFCDLLECHHLSWYLHGIFAYCQISIPSIQFFLHIADLTLETFWCLFFELIRSQRRVSRQSLSHWPSLSCHPLKLAQNFREVVSSHVFSVCLLMKREIVFGSWRLWSSQSQSKDDLCNESEHDWVGATF